MSELRLQVLSGGAAQGVLTQLAARQGIALGGRFGPVGAMQQALLAGEPADLLVLTRALIDSLADEGHVLRDSVADLGVVRTGVAVRERDPHPQIGDRAALLAALRAADEIHFPDPERSTAGVHFAGVLDTLGLRTTLAGRLRPHASGATAMRELAHASCARAIGCTQVTEIRATPGLALLGPLPGEFELATTYSAAVSARAAHPDRARAFAALLGGPASRALRAQAGFEFEDPGAA